MMLYLWLKYIHIISSTILFGTGIGIASTLFYAYKTKDPQVIASMNQYVVIADWIFTAPSATIQPITGVWLVYLAGFSFKSTWIVGSIIGYCIAAFCWFPVVYLQLKMRDLAFAANLIHQPLPDQYHRYFRIWFLLGWPAFISLIIVFYLMTFKPF